MRSDFASSIAGQSVICTRAGSNDKEVSRANVVSEQVLQEVRRRPDDWRLQMATAQWAVARGSTRAPGDDWVDGPITAAESELVLGARGQREDAAKLQFDCTAEDRTRHVVGERVFGMAT